MKTGKEIQKIWREMYEAKNRYIKAVSENLKEIGGELETVSLYRDSESGDPKGVDVHYFNSLGEACTCVVDKVRYADFPSYTSIEFHIFNDEDGEQDYWLNECDMDWEAVDLILSCIVWPE